MADEPQLVGTLADEEAAMRQGKGKSLIVLIGMGVLLVGGLVALMGGGDEKRVYGELGKAINGMKRANFDQFWGCAIKGKDLKALKSNEDLASELLGRGGKGGQRYAVHVREKCLPKLADIGPTLETLIIPAELQPDVDDLKEATSDLRGAFSGYITYLDDEELEFVREEAEPHVKKVTRGWYDFKKAHAAINKTLKAKLKD